ncbi:MAG: C-terminal helicase domain-containing protein [Gammaproteobacteria bacterium]|nr:C-terminal helicase domain-containing protein [Gammaproteobacteria bacterium]
MARIVARWKKQHFLSDRDQKILMAALQSMRMVCDSTYLLDPKQNHGKKIPELLRVLGDLLADPDLKVVIFSQWLRSHELLSSALDHAGHGYVLFHGGVPGRKRGALVKRFQTEPACRVFLSTDAGGVGLNLQRASVVMNLDLPWNPAVLEQRIGRAHRLGQHRSVQVLNFVAEASIEHNLMELLEFKQSLAAGVLDGGENQVHLGGSRLARFMESVERATTQPVADSSPLVPVDSQAVGAADGEPAKETIDRTAERSLESDVDHDRDPWQPLLAFAQTLLTEMAEPSRRKQRRSSGRMVRRDPQTGERYLHLPVPDQDKMTRLLDALRDVLAG